MLNEEGLSFDECDLIMNEPQRKRGRPITSKLGGISRKFSERVMENPFVQFNENLIIKPDYLPLFSQVGDKVNLIDEKLNKIKYSDDNDLSEFSDDSFPSESS